jgi:hypothetical protein
LAKSHPIASVAFVPPLVYPGSPDFAVIRQNVQTSVAKATDAGAKQAKAAKKAAKQAGKKAGTTTGTKTGEPTSKGRDESPDDSKGTGGASDLNQVCSAGSA